MVPKKILLPKVIIFEWDKWNLNKNRLKHNVEPNECEDIFFNKPLILSDDPTHSHIEERFRALGKTNKNRLLFTAFTLRNEKIRVISARDTNKREIIIYKKVGGEINEKT